MKTLLFDVDDTLLDFKLAEKKALHALFEEENVPFTSEVESTYHRINQGLWRSFEEGKITKYIVTNGVAKTQYRRLEDSKLMPYFKDIFVSEEVGYQKPMKEYFDFVFERIPNFSREKTMIIGDSLHSDIQGGQQAKIQTVWLNPTSAPATPTIQPNYTIQQLDELLPILGH